jgi:uncharacterized sulfatase
MKFQYLKTIIICTSFLGLCYSCKTVDEEKKTNILFIMMDDLGYGQFGIYNDTITTADFNPFYVHLVDSLEGYSLDKSLEFSKTAIPTLTKLAKEGLIFTNAYTSSNICAPSRLGIATGTSQNRIGVYTNNDCETSGLIQGTHLAEKLKQVDYKTAHIGKWHIGKRNKGVIKDILKRNGLSEDLNPYKIINTHPEVYKAIKESGYIGSVIDEQHPLNNGFDYYFGYNHWASDFYNATNVWENYKHAGKQESYNTDTFTDKALQFMDTQLDAENPFYVQLHYHAVHDSLEPIAPKKYYDKFDSKSHRLNNFYAHVYGVDQNVGRIVEHLKSKGAYENTLIIFTSDNGAMAAGSYDGHKTGSPLPANTPFSGHKGTYFQGGIRVPFFMHWPHGIQESGIRHQLVSAMDILPTSIDVAGGEIPKDIDGKSLIPLINTAPEKPIHDHLTWAGIHSYKWGYLIQKSTKDHSTEDKFAPPAWVVIKDDYLLRYIGILEPEVYLEHMPGREGIIELFNIKNDPSELHNVAEQYPEIVEALTKIYMEDSKDYPPPPNWKKSKWEEIKSTL